MTNTEINYGAFPYGLGQFHYRRDNTRNPGLEASPPEPIDPNVRTRDVSQKPKINIRKSKTEEELNELLNLLGFGANINVWV